MLLLASGRILATPYHYWWGYYAHYRPAGTLLAGYQCAVLLFLFACCWHTWRRSPPGSRRRQRAKLLLIAFGVAFTAAIDFLPCWGVGLYPFGYAMVAFTIATIGYAAWRYRVVSVTSRAAAKHVLRTLSDGVLVLDDQGHVALANERAQSLLARDAGELLGRPVAEVLPSVQHRAERGDTPSLRPLRQEVEFTGSDGRRRVLNVSVNNMRDAHAGAPLSVYVLQDVTHYRDATDTIRELVYFDQPTGLPNRRHFCDKLARTLAQAPGGRLSAVCSIRLEHVRRLAGVPGEHAADQLAAAVASRLTEFAAAAPRDTVTVARLQDQQFALLFEQAESVGSVTVQLNRVEQMLREPIAAGAARLRPLPWMGVSLYPNDGRSVEALMQRAEAAADQAAEARAGHAQFFNAETNAAALRALELSGRLARCIEKDELCVRFQPVIDLHSGAVSSAEALVRWNDPATGPRLPDEFVPVAEQSGLVAALDRWVLKTAVQHAAQWRAHAGPGPAVAVNFSGAHLSAASGAHVADVVHTALEQSGLAPHRLEIEITETKVVATDSAMVSSLRRLRELGVRIAVDDFGTGYASLSYLEQFPVDKLKVDRSFTAAIDRDRKKTALLQSILMLASQLDLEVVAEGVESAEQVDFLPRNGCRFAQGYFFSQPLPAEAFRQFLSAGAVSLQES